MTAQPTASDRQRDASDPRSSAWVNANAGSGKTHVLVDRVIRLLLDGAEPSKHHVPHLHQGGSGRNVEPPVRAPQRLGGAAGA